MDRFEKHLIWVGLALIGAFTLGYIALNRGEQINALWIVIASVCIYLIAYRYLFVSTRCNGRSLGELVKEEMGNTAGVIALVAGFMIMVIILAVLAIILVKALTHSPWGTYTVAFTIPLALFMGVYNKVVGFDYGSAWKPEESRVLRRQYLTEM